MVSTRGPKYKYSVGERVLCYEPDQTKAKVLYDSKVIEVIEGKDRKGKRNIEYLIHFQGWNSSWDRTVQEDFVLKDTEKNRQLQRDLAEKSQLQIKPKVVVTRSGAYLYRKDRSKRQRLSSSASIGDSKPHTRSSTEDSSCGSVSAINTPQQEDVEAMETTEEITIEDDTETGTSSDESAVEDDRVAFQISDSLKQFLEYDFIMITKQNKLVNLPAKIPVTTILENYVKYHSIKTICGPVEVAAGPRRRNSAAKNEKREKDFEKIRNRINLRKEVADGIRIYFDFLLKNYLLYNQEKQQVIDLLSPENLKNFTYTVSEVQSLDSVLAFKQDTSTSLSTIPEQSEASTSTASTSEAPATEDNSTKRRLRSHKNAEEENEFILDLGAVTAGSSNSSESGSSGNQGAQVTQMSSLSLLRQLLPTNMAVPMKTRELIQDVLSWQILPADAPIEPSMIFGSVHLSRLLVKLPEFLNASPMSEEKLRALVPFLNSFIEFLETHKEWFTEEQYKDAIKIEPADSDDNMDKDVEMPGVSTPTDDSS